MKAGILLCLLMNTTALWSQQNNLSVDGHVKNETTGQTTEAIIKLYKNGKVVHETFTGKDGFFKVSMDFNHEYIMEISKPGFVTKRMLFDTNNVPAEEQTTGFEYGGFTINLFEQQPDMDYSVWKQPAAKVLYDPVVKYFQHDPAYSERFKAETKNR